jgi:hypothetical protein
MERAEFAAGSIEVRGSSAIHRFLGFLGAFFLGIGPTAQRERDGGNWWDRDPSAVREDDAAPVAFGRQTELFDETGQAAFTPAEPVVVLPSAAPVAPAVPKAVPRVAPRTLVSVQARSASSARRIATTRPHAAVRVAAVAKTGTAARGTVARHLLMSQSISSGREESRWFSVPQRALLPRYQLFEGADGVTEEAGGGLRIGARSMRTQRGHVWFV